MLVMGISFGYHDSSVAIVEDGNIIVAADEERFSRIKHDNNFPFNALEFCLKYINKKIDNIDKIIYYENPYKKLNRLLDTAQDDNSNSINDILTHWISHDKLDPLRTIAENLGISTSKITFTDHHLSHASAAFFSSTLINSTIVTIDGVGEYETITILKGENTNLTKLKSYTLPNSLGMLYSAFTSFLGFKINEGEYKVMGMASYGEPIYLDKIKETVSIKNNGEFLINEEYYDFTSTAKEHLKEKFHSKFGEKRDISIDFFIKEKDAPIFLSEELKNIHLEKNRYYANIAASIQRLLEEIVISIIDNAIKLTGYNSLCFSGGVALNATANGKIKKHFDLDSFFIQPAAGDSGNALGAALYYTYCVKSLARVNKKFSPFLGKKYLANEILTAIEDYMIINFKEYISKSNFAKEVASLLIQDKVIGFFNERFEFGPRALGHRSIIASPVNESMQHKVNEKIKFRELFRPFAPSVLKEEAPKWFHIDNPIDENAPENFMITTVKVRDEKIKLIPAVTHFDQTARIQLVSEDNELYCSVIKEFFKLSEVPILLNTSFNLKGEPVVNSPQDAIKTFEACDMDILAIYPYILYKNAKDIK